MPRNGFLGLSLNSKTLFLFKSLEPEPAFLQISGAGAVLDLADSETLHAFIYDIEWLN